MTTDKRTSVLVAEQFPEFVLEEGPQLVAFMKAYYEWMEQEGNLTDALKNNLKNQDIDTTLDRYVEWFKREVMDAIPDDIRVDKRFLIKHIRDLYTSKGSPASFRLLFRILYNEEIDLYWPSEDILRTSDGRYEVPRSIRVSEPVVGNPDLLEGLFVTGITSGATAKVESISRTNELGVDVREMFLSNISGTFVDNEKIRNDANTVQATIINTIGPLSGLTIIEGGAGHEKGDQVVITGASGTGAIGTVTETNNLSAINFRLVRGGHGYRANSVITVGGPGLGATFEITSITNTESIAIDTDKISALKNVRLENGVTFVTGGSNTATVSANLASANISSLIGSALAYANITVGSIGSISTVTSGYGFVSIPSVTIEDLDVSVLQIPATGGGFKGRNAVVVANNGAGAIANVVITTPGAAYNRLGTLTLTNSRSGTTAASARPRVSGVITYPGRYTDTKGFLSWNNRLQDNYYYQEFSYVIRSDNFTNTYRDLVRTIIHPAGTKMFGDFRIYGTADFSDIEATTDGLDTKPSNDDYIWTLMAGTLAVSSCTYISAYSSNTIAALTGGSIDLIGTSRLVIGNNTTFTANGVVSTSIIKIRHGGANNIYSVNSVFSNTALTLATNYANSNITNATWYTASPIP